MKLFDDPSPEEIYNGIKAAEAMLESIESFNKCLAEGRATQEDLYASHWREGWAFVNDASKTLEMIQERITELELAAEAAENAWCLSIQKAEMAKAELKKASEQVSSAGGGTWLSQLMRSRELARGRRRVQQLQAASTAASGAIWKLREESGDAGGRCKAFQEAYSTHSTVVQVLEKAKAEAQASGNEYDEKSVMAEALAQSNLVWEAKLKRLGEAQSKRLKEKQRLLRLGEAD